MTKAEMEKRNEQLTKRKRKSKETLRFDGVEYTVQQVFADHALRGKYIRRLEGVVKQGDRQIRSMTRLLDAMTDPKKKAEHAKLLDVASFIRGHEEMKASLAMLKSAHLNGGRPAQPGRA